MKNIILGLITILAIFSCDVAQDQATEDKVNVSFGVSLPKAGSRNLNTITSPTVNYTVMEGTAVYMTGENIPLTKDMDSFKLDIALRKGLNYRFTEFTVKNGTTSVYALDTSNTINTTGFSVNASGTVTPNPTEVYLNYQLPDEYTDKDAQSTRLILVEDFFTAEDLTFRVNIPTGITITLCQQKPNGSTFKSTSLQDKDIFDMDSSTVSNGEGGYNYNSDGDVTTYHRYISSSGGYWRGESGGADQYYFYIRNDNKSYRLYFKSSDYNKKEIDFANLGS